VPYPAARLDQPEEFLGAERTRVEVDRRRGVMQPQVGVNVMNLQLALLAHGRISSIAPNVTPHSSLMRDTLS
jgi:hypothetical protein